MSARIRGEAVPTLLPAHGPVHVLLIGEAPGPRGADKSGFPFFGDAAGRHLYRVLSRTGAVAVPAQLWEQPWDGAGFASAGLIPVAHGVALGNAFPCCPTEDGFAFRAPSKRELEGPENLTRLATELCTLAARGLVGVLTMGRVATKTMDVVFNDPRVPTLTRRAIPHPSAQGLLSMAPNRGKGARMADLQALWMDQCEALLVECGFVPSELRGAV
ncbi:MAG: hypothetical protein IT353_09515 [Gemmatimonadaceae bacterium]|nr:hypothetical protein [Gemmatimonadaceae bacterium]